MFKSLLSVAVALPLFVAIVPTKSFAHGGGDEPRVEIEVESSATAPAGKVEFIFDLVDNIQKKTLSDLDLAVDMEKKLHFIAYDAGLVEFQHVHPDFRADGKWHVDLNFSRSGEYYLWASGKVAADSKDFAASTKFEVTSGETANPAPAQLNETRTASSGNSVVTLSNSKLTAGKMAMVNVTFSRNDGSAPVISPYLGALAHVTIVTDDADSMIHAHPMATGQPNKVMLHTTFPTAGLYRVWLEFIDGGVLKRVALVVNVES